MTHELLVPPLTDRALNRVLVTGANGFIGARVVARFGTMLPVRAAVRSVSGIAYGVAAETVQLSDITASDQLRGALDGITHVVHLAGISTNSERAHSPAELIRVNAEGTARVAAAAREAGVQRVVFVSSIGAVCSRSEAPVDDTTIPRPDSAYGASKLKAEGALKNVLQDSNTEWTILRPPLVYGPGQPASLLRLWRYVQRGIPLPLKRVHNRRSFISVDNLVSAIESALLHPGAAYRTFPVADSEVISTPDLISILARSVNRLPRLFGMNVELLRVLARSADGVKSVGLAVPFSSETLEQLIGSLEIDSTAFRTATAWQPERRTHEALASAFAPAA